MRVPLEKFMRKLTGLAMGSATMEVEGGGSNNTYPIETAPKLRRRNARKYVSADKWGGTRVVGWDSYQAG